MTSTGISSPMYISSFQSDLGGPIAYRFGDHNFGNILPSCTSISINEYTFEQSEGLTYEITPLECSARTNIIACEKTAEAGASNLNLIPKMEFFPSYNETSKLSIENNLIVCAKGHTILRYLFCDERSSCIVNSGYNFFNL